MTNKNKLVVVSLLTIVMILATFILMVNDMMNYALVTITVAIIAFIYLCVTVMKKDDELSRYNKKLKNILKTYDSILVYSGEKLELDDENIILVKSFEDIITAQEELKKPLLYISSKRSSLFMIKDGNELIIYILKTNEKLTTRFELQIIKYLKSKQNSKPENKKILEDLEKTTFIQLKNNKVYKISPIKEKKED